MLNRGHHPIGPSTAGRRYLCPGSLKMEQGLPDVASAEATEGSLNHEGFALASEKWIESGVRPTEFSSPNFLGDVDLINKVLDRRAEYLDVDAPTVCYIEEEMELHEDGRILHDHDDELLCWGTADAIFATDVYLLIQDTKTGWGGHLQFEAAQFQAGLYYAMACQHIHKVCGRVEFFMVHTGDKTWMDFEPDMIPNIIKTFKAVRDACEQPDYWRRLNPSPDACHWCRAKGVCPAFRAVTEESTALVMGTSALAPIPEEEKGVVSLRRKEEFLSWYPVVERAAKQLKEELKAAVGDGYESELFSLCSRRGREFFPRPNNAYQLLKSQLSALQWFELCAPPKVKVVIERAAEAYAAENKCDKKTATAAIRDLVEPEVERGHGTTFLRRKS